MVLQALTSRSWSLGTACGVSLLASLFLGSEPKGLNSTQSLTQSDQDVRVLNPGIQVERELVGGQSHRYQISRSAGQYLHVVVDQRGIYVIVALRGPDGVQLTEIDGMPGSLGGEELVWEAANTGAFVLEVRARFSAGTQGAL